MKYIYTSLVLSTIFTSCAMRIDYLGSASTPTNNVDVYVDPSAIKRPYTIIGKGYPSQLGTMFNQRTNYSGRRPKSPKRKEPMRSCFKTILYSTKGQVSILLPGLIALAKAWYQQQAVLFHPLLQQEEIFCFYGTISEGNHLIKHKALSK